MGRARLAGGIEALEVCRSRWTPVSRAQGLDLGGVEGPVEIDPALPCPDTRDRAPRADTPRCRTMQAGSGAGHRPARWERRRRDRTPGSRPAARRCGRRARRGGRAARRRSVRLLAAACFAHRSPSHRTGAGPLASSMATTPSAKPNWMAAMRACGLGHQGSPSGSGGKRQQHELGVGRLVQAQAVRSARGTRTCRLEATRICRSSSARRASRRPRSSRSSSSRRAVCEARRSAAWRPPAARRRTREPEHQPVPALKPHASTRKILSLALRARGLAPNSAVSTARSACGARRGRAAGRGRCRPEAAEGTRSARPTRGTRA